MERERLNQKQLNDILRKHKMWMNRQQRGEQAIFQDVDISGLDLSNRDLRGVAFYNVMANQTDFSKSRIGHNLFNNCDISGSTFCNSEGFDIQMMDCKAQSVLFIDAKLKNINVDSTDLSKSDFTNTKLRKSCFTNIPSMDETLFEKNNFSEAVFTNIQSMQNAIFKNENFTNSLFKNVNLDNTSLENVSFSEKGSKNIFDNVSLCNAIISGKSFFEKDGKKYQLSYYYEHQLEIEEGKVIPLENSSVSSPSLPIEQ